MKKIQISNYVYNNRSCPYYTPINDYTPPVNSYDLTTYTGQGQYYHDCINKLLNGLPLERQNAAIERDARSTYEWLSQYQNIQSEQELTVETPAVAITGKPDAYIYDGRDLTVIEYKYSDMTDSRHYKQLILYTWLIIQTHPEWAISNVNLIVYYAKTNYPDINSLTRDMMQSLINEELEALYEYIAILDYTVVNKCLTCSNCPDCSYCQHECYTYAVNADATADRSRMLFCQQIINKKFQIYKESGEKSNYKAYPQNKETLNKIAELAEEKAAAKGFKPPKVTKYITKSEAEKYIPRQELEKFYETKSKGPSPQCPWE